MILANLFAAILAAFMPTNPCATEDQSTPCVWDAQVQGNGQGSSFYVLPGGARVYFDSKEG